MENRPKVFEMLSPVGLKKQSLGAATGTLLSISERAVTVKPQ